jgi:hypothetical protein
MVPNAITRRDEFDTAEPMQYPLPKQMSKQFLPFTCRSDLTAYSCARIIQAGALVYLYYLAEKPLAGCTLCECTLYFSYSPYHEDSSTSAVLQSALNANSRRKGSTMAYSLFSNVARQDLPLHSSYAGHLD